MKLLRETLSDQIIQKLLEVIESQHLKPGDLLPSETKLAEDFGVSRPIVREAFKALAGRGVVEIISGKGAILKPIDDRPLQLFFQRAIQLDTQTLIELMEVRTPLEVQSARLAAQRRTDDDVTRMHEIVEHMGQNLNDMQAYSDFDVDFHLLIAAATQNKMIFNLISSIRLALKDTMLQGLLRRRTQAQIERVQVLHEIVLENIEVGNAVGAAEAMTQHFDDALAALLADPIQIEDSSA